MRFLSQNLILAGLYLRLSREDGDKAESDSIRNQRELINDFVRQHPEIKLIEEYVDDGYSGTNFERPAFQRMIEDAKNKKINCIIVKDLSRLGRNYIETGRYLEKIFPVLGIRFIAVNDHYDSADGSDDSDQIIVPFKNLINDAYCRDISIKIRSQLEVKRKDGKFIGNFASYGYLKDPKDKNHLIIDEYAGEIVKLIFNMKMDGYSAGRIADKLTEMGVMTPMEYKQMCGLKFYSGFRSSTNPIWHASSVTRILQNEVYTGTMVQGKTRKINYKVKKCIPVEESNWERVNNTHEEIVPKMIFECVKNLMKLDTRTSPGEENVYPLSGLLRCGDCGQNLVRRTATKKNKKYFYYHCTTYKNGGDCTSHNVSEDTIKKCVLGAIQNQITLLVNAQNILSQVENLPQQRFGVKVLDSQILSLQKEIEKYKDLKAKLYQDMTDNVISREEYQDLNRVFTQKRNDAKTALTEVERRKKKMLSGNKQVQPWISAFISCNNLQTLERKVLVTLIDRIVVYSKEKIEIHFNYEDEMSDFIEYAMEQQSYDKRKMVNL